MQLQEIVREHIDDGYLNICESDWKEINKIYSKENIKSAIKAEILSGNISLPLRRLTIDDAAESFRDLLDYRCKPLEMARLTTRYEYQFDDLMNGLCVNETNIGNTASDFFQQENRFYCDSINSPSPARTWNNDKFLNGMLDAIWSLKCKEVNDGTFRTCLSLRKYVSSQFKPSVAKSIYEWFGSVDVLDFSAGWGDRLCGFYACKNTKSYIGIDPNTRVFEKYPVQAEFYSQFSPDKKTTFICEAAEDVSLPSGIVDTVFTSPPYFNIERYSQENTQSFKRYKKLGEWLNQFLFKSIEMSVSALKRNGHLIINISDVYSGHRINKICDPMNYFIKDLGLKYVGVVGMKMAKRPNSRAIGDGIFVEPMWVWRKVR